MSQQGSVDPFSTFLNTADQGEPSASVPVSQAAVLRALLAKRDSGPVTLRELSREVESRTTQVAVLVASLDVAGLVTIGVQGDEDTVALTEAGVAAATRATGGQPGGPGGGQGGPANGVG